MFQFDKLFVAFVSLLDLTCHSGPQAEAFGGGISKIGFKLVWILKVYKSWDPDKYQFHRFIIHTFSLQSPVF